MSSWTTQAPVGGQSAIVDGSTVILSEPYCPFGTDPINGNVGYWGRYPDQSEYLGLYNLAPAALRVFDSASGIKTLEVKITAYGGTGGPGDGHNKHRVGFASLNMESAYYLEWENSIVYLCKRVAGVMSDDDEVLVSFSLSEVPSASHPVWLRLTLDLGVSIAADVSEALGAWTAIPDIPAGTGSEFAPAQYVIALHTVNAGFVWPDGSVTYADVITDEDVPASRRAPQETVEYGFALGSDGDFILDGDQCRQIPAVLHQADIRLLARRGQWVYDLTIGSRFFTIQTLTDAKSKSQLFAQEALQDLIDAGKIRSVEVGEIEMEPITGGLAAPVNITLPSGTVWAMGTYQLGEI